ERRARHLHRALLEIQDQLNPFRASPAGPMAAPGPLHFFEEARADARSALLGPLSEHQSFAPLVRLAETCLWDEPGMPGFVGRGAVAHVLPRTHGQAWQRGFPSDDDRERSKHRLGNLCLVPGELDEAIRTLGFADKRARLATLEARWRSAHDVARYDVWTVGMVETRTQQLARRVARQLGIAGA
ncbi:MAG: HNH endonuclease family protein, partial [Myxococcota bacterium]